MLRLRGIIADLAVQNGSSCYVGMEAAGGDERGRLSIPSKRHTPEQIIGELRDAEVLISQGATIPQAAKQIGITEQTFYRWRPEYGGVKLDHAKRLSEPPRSLWTRLQSGRAVCHCASTRESG